MDRNYDVLLEFFDAEDDKAIAELLAIELSPNLPLKNQPKEFQDDYYRVAKILRNAGYSPKQALIRSRLDAWVAGALMGGLVVAGIMGLVLTFTS